MRNTFAALALLALAAQAQADTGGSTLWPDLWRNADQRGEAMLQQGNASGAAQAYADPRRKAYAQFKAGDYAAAAHALSAFDDSEAHYNRGNALAYAGDLQGALKAFDAALKRDPKSQDARHNRDLVAKALEQQQQNDADKNKPQDNKQDGQKDNRQNGKQDSQPADKPADKPGKQGAGQDGKPGDKPGGKGQPQSAAQNPAKAGPADAQNATGKNMPGSPSAQDKAQPTAQSDAEQARRDANASMRDVQQGQAGGAGKDNAGGVNPAQTGSAPLTETQIAQEQCCAAQHS